MSATEVETPARATPRVSRMCSLALLSVFSDIEPISVAVTKRARVSVTGAVAILFSCEMGDMKVHYRIKKAIGNSQKRIKETEA
jgi:hypothetical protein